MARIKRDANGSVPSEPNNPSKRGNGSVFTSSLKNLKVELTSEDKDILRRSEFPDATVLQWVFANVLTGLKFSLTLDKEHTSAIATLTDLREGSGSYGYTLQGRGKTPQNATVALYFKDVHILGGVWDVDGVMADNSDFG